MSFEHDPTNGVKLYGPDGAVVWASSRSHAYWTDYVSGSFTIASMPDGNANSVGTKSTRNLHPVAAHATHVMGSFRATQSGGYAVAGVSDGGIHMLGGTTLLMVAVYPMYPSTWGDITDVRYTTWITGAKDDLSAAIILSTYVQGGWLKAEVERYKPIAGGGSSSWSGLGTGTITISYQGVAYTFDN